MSAVETNINRRSLLRIALASPVLLTPALRALAASPAQTGAASKAPDVGTGPFSLPPLPYAYNALEPHIDAVTMLLHHDKHHATYVKNLNEAASKSPEVAKKTPIALISDLDSVPEGVRQTVRNNGGGHVNHTMFWESMKPGGGGEPVGPLADRIRATFSSFNDFKTQFNDAGTKRFGSGWVWLVLGNSGDLEIKSTANQDNPLMKDQGGVQPLLGNDVWEHAYYLKYQNRRADYLKAWWNTVNWQVVNDRFVKASKAP